MPDDISRRIQEAIKRSGKTLVELQKVCGVPHAAIQRYATGKTSKIPIDRVRSIAKACNVSASWIMGWSDDPDEKIPFALDSAPPMELTQGEASLIRAFRRMDDSEKLMVLKLIRGIQLSHSEGDESK